jgi:hypothetical protein
MTESLKAFADVLAQRIAHQTLEPMLTKKQAARYCFTAVRFQRTSFPQRKSGKSFGLLPVKKPAFGKAIIAIRSSCVSGRGWPDQFPGPGPLRPGWRFVP